MDVVKQPGCIQKQDEDCELNGNTVQKTQVCRVYFLEI